MVRIHCPYCYCPLMVSQIIFYWFLSECEVGIIITWTGKNWKDAVCKRTNGIFNAHLFRDVNNVPVKLQVVIYVYILCIQYLNILYIEASNKNGASSAITCAQLLH